MCDPITIGLMVAGTAAQAYGAHRVESAQKKDIARFGEKYQEERATQGKLTGENEQTVGKTLDLYGKPAQDVASAAAIKSRTDAYTNPFEGKPVTTAMSADFDPNNIIAARNDKMGAAVRERNIGDAVAKANLDAYGDNQTRTAIAANDNANQIGMVGRIARSSRDAANQYQAVLPTAMQADKNAGATWNSIGQALQLASMASGMSSGFGSGASFGSFSSPNMPVDLGSVTAPSAGSLGGVPMRSLSFPLGTVSNTAAPSVYSASGLAGALERGYNSLSPFGTKIGAQLPVSR